MTVFVLQAFAIERGATCGGAKDETTGQLIGCCPETISSTLEAEH